MYPAGISMVSPDYLPPKILRNDKNHGMTPLEFSDSLSSMKLFIVSMHPNENLMPLASANKLQQLKPREIATIARNMGGYPTAAAYSINAPNDVPGLGNIMLTRGIDHNDLHSYWQLAAGRITVDSNNP